MTNTPPPFEQGQIAQQPPAVPGQPYPGQQQPGQPYPGQPFAPGPRTNVLAIISLVSAFFVSLAAIITGHIALGQIKRTGEAGRGLAIAGLILGYAGVVFTILLVAFLLVFSVGMGAFIAAVTSSASGPVASSVSPVEPSTQIPSGTQGAARFDDGYLSVGAGNQVVDLYFDPMCPYCAQFEEANGEHLADLVADGSITLRLHALTFLDTASLGTEYSTRAASALTCEATLNPDSTLDYLAALYAQQPAEGTEGLSDSELASLSNGGASIADCIDDGEYQLWAQQNTENALNGPIPGSDLPSIQGTPTVLVDGEQYKGSITDPAQFTAFLTSSS